MNLKRFRLWVQLNMVGEGHIDVMAQSAEEAIQFLEQEVREHHLKSTLATQVVYRPIHILGLQDDKPFVRVTKEHNE